ncbi:6-phosphogluconolactonase [Edaphobacter bradus]|uniref:6-phosphogluconolactonase n=1 Tax=Edaphobacter bradus TaxID=2259016 RepID=UPI0021E0D954|nr:6-phosphogluconolactonase [Edaphobacter bradus]
MKVEVHETRQAAGQAAAEAAATAFRHAGHDGKDIPVIFATGASQLETLRALTQIGNIPWERVQAFHMDEYVGMAPDHPASFRRYLHENLVRKVPLKQFYEIDGTEPDPARVCEDYASAVRAARPQVCLLGIGENGHLAFNDPHVADFYDPLDVKIVDLDDPCRVQQAAEGWFESFEKVPPTAMTLTIPTLFRVPRLIASVPGVRKASIVRRALTEPISRDCPATILRTHPDATLFLDMESAAELDGF